MKALVDYAPNVHDVEIVQVLTIGAADYVKPGMEEHLRVNTLFISDNVRPAVNEGRADFTPMFLSEIPQVFKTVLPVDVALIQVSPPDDHGYCSFGVEVGVTKAAAQAAKIVIAEVNQQMPRTLGDSFIHVSKTHAHHSGRLQVAGNADGQHVRDCGADRQAHRGAHSRWRHAANRHRRDSRCGVEATDRPQDLGVHTELFADGVIDLVERGVINGERKIDPSAARSWPGSCWARSAYTALPTTTRSSNCTRRST